MSGVFQNIDPPPPSPPGEIVPPPPLVRGEDTLAGWREGWGVNSLEWNTPDKALYYTYVSRYFVGPTFGDFVTIHTEGSMQDKTGARLQSTEYRLPSPPLLNVMYIVRVSLWTVKIFLAQN
jgi:hypothetical protein